MNSLDIELNKRVEVLQNQRNQAMDAIAHVAGQLAVAQADLAGAKQLAEELTTQNTELREKLEAAQGLLATAFPDAAN